MNDEDLICPKCGYDNTHDILRDARPDCAVDVNSFEDGCYMCDEKWMVTVEWRYSIKPLPGAPPRTP